MLLSDNINISKRFLRSVRIDNDFGFKHSLEGYISSPSSMDVLVGLAKHVQETRQGAFTWTGPYGSGKSSLALVLAALLNGNKKQREHAAELVGKNVAEAVWAAMPPQKFGWKVLPLVGKNGPPKKALIDGLVQLHLITPEEQNSIQDTDIVNILVNEAAKNPESTGGVLLIIDEMGKLLEAAAQNSDDIYILQLLAEAASRSKGRFIFIGILHQAFGEYAQRLLLEQRNEWEKINGRFVDLLVSISGDEHLELLSKAIHHKSPIPEDGAVAEAVAQTIRAGRGSYIALKQTLEQCWPLHPVVASLLGSVSRRRFGQNQRSLFSFLGSAEPFGFQDFLNTPRDIAEFYYPSMLWEYLRANLEPAILASPDGHKWAMAMEAIDRCSAIGASDKHTELLKNIALIDSFKERTGLSASKHILQTVIDVEGEQQLDKLLKDLENWSFIIYRKHLGAYSIFAGSDFDVEAALKTAISSNESLDFKKLAALAGFRPILAKRHYHQTGALRWCSVGVAPVNELLNTVRLIGDDDSAIGAFLLAVPTENESEHQIELKCLEAVALANRPVFIGVSRHAKTMLQLANEFVALNKVSDESPELTGDSVARREVSARVTDLHSRLEASLQRLFESSKWYGRDIEPSHLSFSEISTLTSKTADRIFSNSPRILNELLNREKPSSNAVAAQKALLKKMVSAEGKERLDISGFPPEGAFCDSLLVGAGIYKESDGRWHFTLPQAESDPSNLTPLWSLLTDYLQNSKEKIVSAETLYSIMRRPPFGIKTGLLPVLLVAFILSKRSDLAIYREGIFQAHFDDYDIDYLTVAPATIQLRWMDLPEASKQLLGELASVVCSFDQVSQQVIGDGEPIDIGRGLVKIFLDLPQWVKRTSRLSRNALVIRDMLKRANDPNKLIFDDIQSLVDGEPSYKVIKAVVKKISDGLNELTAAYDSMLHRLQDLMLEELLVPNSSEQSFSDLRSRAKNIKQISGDLKTDAFIDRLAFFEGKQDELEGIISLLIGKPTTAWIDSDIDKASVALAEMSQTFIKLETLAHIKGRANKRHSMAVIININGRRAPVVRDFNISEADMREVNELINTLEKALNEASAKLPPNIMLAAIAEYSARFLTEDNNDSEQ